MTYEIALEGSKVLMRAIYRTFRHFFPADRPITVEESLKILGIDRNEPFLVRSAFERLYNKNAEDRGGSPYIKLKILNAFKRLKGDH